MATRSGLKTITLKMFNAVKILLESGESRKSIAEYMGISVGSVNKIATADDFEDYKQKNNAYHFMKKKEAEKKETERLEAERIEAEKKEAAEQKEPIQVVEHRQSVTLVANHYMAEQLQKQTELLTLISNKLAFIVDELCGTTVRKEG